MISTRNDWREERAVLLAATCALIDDHREPWVEVTINRVRWPVMASDRQQMLPSLQRRADADRGEDGSK